MRLWLILMAGIAASLPSFAEERTDAPKADPAPETASAQGATRAIPASGSFSTDAPNEKIPTDGGRPDSLTQEHAKAAPDVVEGTLPCLEHVEFLRRHNDPVMAIEYLKSIMTNPSLLPQDRSRVIIELADTLQLRGENAEALCWLKVWTQLFPGRREFAAVAYRIAEFYSKMGMPDLARDAYYLALAHAVNQGEMVNPGDLMNYNKLTTATLWGLAANEYQAGQWPRAAELFERYRREATAASPLSLEKSEFLQADCYYQLRQADAAIKQYDGTLAKHPFNPLAPQARLRLYHLYMIKNEPGKAQAELQALVWTVRTVWPKDDAYWQKQTAQFLLAINQKDSSVMPPLVRQSAQLPAEGKSWQDTIKHYDALVSYQVVRTSAMGNSHADSFSKIGDEKSVEEENDLLVMNSRLNQVLGP
jgi:outer membrane protein assembly factor BamD (BamD/ComL family)